MDYQYQDHQSLKQVGEIPWDIAAANLRQGDQKPASVDTPFSPRQKKSKSEKSPETTPNHCAYLNPGIEAKVATDLPV